MKFGNENKVYKLKKILYELKQVLRVWYNHIETYFFNEKFQIYLYDHILFFYNEYSDASHPINLVGQSA